MHLNILKAKYVNYKSTSSPMGFQVGQMIPNPSSMAYELVVSYDLYSIIEAT